LKDKLLKGIIDVGFDKPSPVQEECIPLAIASKNLKFS
jgi:superfamily II DNA/RNA helicase